MNSSLNNSAINSNILNDSPLNSALNSTQATSSGIMSSSSVSSTVVDSPLTDQLSLSSLIKRDSYKDRRKMYLKQKKRAAEEILSVLNDPTVLVMADWLKVRGTLKGWTKVFCELKPGLLLLYKSNKTYKSGYWVGTILLNICEIIERPSKKDGFCFKLYNPLDQTIWSSRV